MARQKLKSIIEKVIIFLTINVSSLFFLLVIQEDVHFTPDFKQALYITFKFWCNVNVKVTQIATQPC